MLRERVVVGEFLTLRNLTTNEEIIATVIDIDECANGVREVGVEFAVECSRFWRVSFPPADWTPRCPEAKQHVDKRNPAPNCLPPTRPSAKK